MRDVSIGQYYPTKSTVHKMDARAKLVFVILYIVMLFFVPSLDNYLAGDGRLGEYIVKSGLSFGVIAVFLVVAIACSKVPFVKVLKSVRSIVYLVIITAVIMLLFYSGKANHVYATWGIITISLEGIVSALVMALRLFLLVMGPSLLSFTTTPVQLTDGIESLLSPLKIIKVPVHDIAIIMSIALRLIPTMVEEKK